MTRLGNGLTFSDFAAAAMLGRDLSNEHVLSDVELAKIQEAPRTSFLSLNRSRHQSSAFRVDGTAAIAKAQAKRERKNAARLAHAKRSSP